MQSSLSSLSSIPCVQTAIASFSHIYSLSDPHSLLRIQISMIQFFLSHPSLYTLYKPQLKLLLSLLQNLLLSSLSVSLTQHQHSLLLSRTHIKLIHFPYSSIIYKTMDTINQNDFEQWIIIEGKIIRAMRKTLQKSKLFKCSVCGWIERCVSTYHNGYVFELPKGCRNEVEREKKKGGGYMAKMYEKMNFWKNKAKGGKGERNESKDSKDSKEREEGKNTKQAKCGNKKFEPVEDTEILENKIFVNYQQLKIQQPFKHITTRGRIPHTLTVILEGLFEEEYRPGEDIVVSGLFSSRYNKLVKGNKLDEEVVIVANSIIVKKLNQTKTFEDEQDEETILSGIPTNRLSSLEETEQFIEKQISKRNHILSLFCPNIYQRDCVKLAIILCSIGGVSKSMGSTKIRGQSHLLLVGQPGTGKSVLLKAAADLCERSFFTNGISSSTAGLTVCHVKCGNEWMIQAGALVLADNGVCCIDEINLMAVKDQESLLEAMEQQTVSSAKAGIIGKLNCRTTVIAACNPIRPGQKFDADLSVSVNTGLIVPLITRFDLVMVLNDTPNLDQDSDKCDLLLGRFLQKEDSYLQNRQQKRQFITLKTIIRKAKSFEPEILQQNILTSYFINVRQRSSQKTVRTFQSLCRLSQAHARLMFREETTEFDCISVIMLMEGQYANTLEEYKQLKRKIDKLMKE